MFSGSGLEACLDSGIQDCSDLQRRLFESHNSVKAVLNGFSYLPIVIGLLLAAPVVIEIERRTYRLAWTQSVTRRRWLGASIGMAILGVAVFSALFTALMTWWYEPVERAYMHLGHGVGPGFTFAGLLPFSYTLWAMSLALAAGVLSRKVVLAAPVAFVGFLAMRIPVEQMLRPSYEQTEFGAAANMGRDIADSFWEYQAIEAAIFVCASALLLGLTAWVVSRRTR